MAWVWTGVGTLGLAAATVTLAVAWIVYASNPRRTQNRLLASALALFLGSLVGGNALMYLTDDPAETYAWQAAGVVCLIAFYGPYIAFLSTLPTPLARPLARVRGPIVAVAAVAPLLWFAVPRKFVADVVPGQFAPWDIVAGPWLFALFFVGLGVALVGLAFAVSAYRHAAPRTLARAQAGAYLAAFAVFDGQAIVFFGYAIATGEAPEWLLLINTVGPLASMVLLAYGMLKTQLFDIDLKVKWTLRRGTVVTVFVAVFLVATAVAEQYLQRYGVLAGGVAAGLLLVALRPIERAADRLADRAMPGARDTAEYRTVRKREVYRAAVGSALEDGSLSDKDRGVLATLAQQLGLGAKDAHDIEREARAARVGGT